MSNKPQEIINLLSNYINKIKDNKNNKFCIKPIIKSDLDFVKYKTKKSVRFIN